MIYRDTCKDHKDYNKFLENAIIAAAKNNIKHIRAHIERPIPKEKNKHTDNRFIRIINKNDSKEIQK